MDAWVGDRPHWLDAGRCSSLRRSATAKVGRGGCSPGRTARRGARMVGRGKERDRRTRQELRPGQRVTPMAGNWTYSRSKRRAGALSGTHMHYSGRGQRGLYCLNRHPGPQIDIQARDGGGTRCRGGVLMTALIKECRGLAACVRELHKTRHKLM